LKKHLKQLFDEHTVDVRTSQKGTTLWERSVHKLLTVLKCEGWDPSALECIHEKNMLSCKMCTVDCMIEQLCAHHIDTKSKRERKRSSRHIFTELKLTLSKLMAQFKIMGYTYESILFSDTVKRKQFAKYLQHTREGNTERNYTSIQYFLNDDADM